MMQRIKAITKFDITYTNITRRFNKMSLPMVDHNNETIADHQTWLYKRRQQSNYETLMQLLSLRSQALNNTISVKNGSLWEMEFEYESSVDMETLMADCHGVPMIIGLDEQDGISSYISCFENANLWFEET